MTEQSKTLRFTVAEDLATEVLCEYDGTQESLDNCVAAMAKDMDIEWGEDGKFSGELIMVMLWGRIMALEWKTQGISYQRPV